MLMLGERLWIWALLLHHLGGSAIHQLQCISSLSECFHLLAGSEPDNVASHDGRFGHDFSQTLRDKANNRQGGAEMVLSDNVQKMVSRKRHPRRSLRSIVGTYIPR
jgi:hypothetical protein